MQSSWPDDGACLLQVFFITSSFKATSQRKPLHQTGTTKPILND